MPNSIGEYIKHYFQMPDFVFFLLLAAALLGIIYYIFYIFAKGISRGSASMEQEFFSLSERFYELIFSGGFIIGFTAIYSYHDIFGFTGKFGELMDKHMDFLLLALMTVAITLTTFFDHILIRLKHINRDTIGAIRIAGMLYTIVILCYLMFGYGSTNYGPIIPYFLTIMIGRFVYFDASFKDFLHCMKKALSNLPIMIIALAYVGILCAYGYSNEYLLKHNTVILNVFFVHIFIIACIFVMRFIPVVMFKSKNKNKGAEHGEELPRNNREDVPKRNRKDSDRRNIPRRTDSKKAYELEDDYVDFDLDAELDRSSVRNSSRNKYDYIDKKSKTDDDLEMIDL
ncbi:MAG: hypothetical protein K5769_01330 [Pseudobutyrivibrio sp.]|nr:hypothetical protein [Pseudobutyrivibrio sp.]